MFNCYMRHLSKKPSVGGRNATPTTYAPFRLPERPVAGDRTATRENLSHSGCSAACLSDAPQEGEGRQGD